jgi:hypothetical protein
MQSTIPETPDPIKTKVIQDTANILNALVSTFIATGL